MLYFNPKTFSLDTQTDLKKLTFIKSVLKNLRMGKRKFEYGFFYHFKIVLCKLKVNNQVNFID